MAVARHDAVDRARTEARADAIDQPFQIRLRVAIAGEVDLRRRQRRRLRHGKARHVETEAGIEFVAKAPEFLPEEREDALRRAQRPAGADGDAGDGAIDAEEREFERARAKPAALERARQRCRERGERGSDILLQRDRLGEAPLGQHRRRRPARADRFFVAPERLIQPMDEPHAEARGERRAGSHPMTCPMRFSPTRSSAATMSWPRRSAASGSGASIAAIAPGGTMVTASVPKRAAAEAAPGVSAMAARTWKPCPVRRRTRSAISTDSPPKRWAQPVMSSINPAGASRATSGV